MDTNNFNELIKPFFWIEHENSVIVILEDFYNHFISKQF